MKYTESSLNPIFDPLAPITNLKRVIEENKHAIKRYRETIDGLNNEIDDILTHLNITEEEIQLYEKALALLESSHQ